MEAAGARGVSLLPRRRNARPRLSAVPCCKKSSDSKPKVKKGPLGIDLGPIADTFRQLMPYRDEEELSKSLSEDRTREEEDGDMGPTVEEAKGDLGPIALSFSQGATKEESGSGEPEAGSRELSVRKLTRDEWRERYLMEDGTVSLWVEDDFNEASRLPGCSPKGLRENVAWDNKNPDEWTAPKHRVSVTSLDGSSTHTVEVPEDRYILFEAEAQGYEIPYSCRMGCCTSCAVKVSKGSIWHPEGLGLSQTLRNEGYALLCVGMPMEEVECQLQDEDEVYMKQFGYAFAELATDKNSPAVQRDDIALEWANCDE